MFKEFYSNKDDDYLSEFRQKIASERQAELQARKQELQRSRNGFIGTIAGIALAGIVSWLLLIPRFNEDKNTEIPVIRRPTNPVKIHPSNPQGMQILNQDKAIYALVEKQEPEIAKIESILPAPEKPKLPEIVPEPEVIAEPEIQEEPKNQEKIAENNDILPIQNLEELIEKVETTTTKKIEIPQKPLDINIEVKTVAPVKKEEPKKEEPKKELATQDIWQLQIMASSNIEAVKKGWKDLSLKHTSLQKLPYNIETATTDTGTPIYRLKTGAFKSKEEAEQHCNNLKKEGLNCIIKQK